MNTRALLRPIPYNAACWYRQAHQKGLIPHLSTADYVNYIVYTCLVQFFSLQVGSAILFRLDMQMYEATQAGPIVYSHHF